MSVDVTLLQAMKYRERYERLSRGVPSGPLDPKTRVLFEDFGKYFAAHPGVDRLEFEPFWLWFAGFAHPTLNEDQKKLYAALLKQAINEDAPAGLEQGLLANLTTAASVQRVAAAATQWEAGEATAEWEVILRHEVAQLELDAGNRGESAYVDDDVIGQLVNDKDDRGLHWRLSCLNTSMRPLIGGDFGIIAARPDKGKTTMVASEITYFAAQVDDLWHDEARCILWLNNEGPGNRIFKRVYQAALGATISEMVELSTADKLTDLYAHAVGRRDIIRIANVHGMRSHEVEQLIRKARPAVVVFDMLDNIRFSGVVSNNGERTDQLLEFQCQWARELAVDLGFVALATSQISAAAEASADLSMWPQLAMLKDSKTGKQGAADFIITQGVSMDATLSRSRFIGMTKNKLLREGANNPRAEVIFDGDRARLRMPD